jgi:hypothetical protein
VISTYSERKVKVPFFRIDNPIRFDKQSVLP